MRIKFLESGESPHVGIFTAGIEREVTDELGQAFVERGLAIKVKHKKNQAQTTDVEEVEHGNE